MKSHTMFYPSQRRYAPRAAYPSLDVSSAVAADARRKLQDALAQGFNQLNRRADVEPGRQPREDARLRELAHWTTQKLEARALNLGTHRHDSHFLVSVALVGGGIVALNAFCDQTPADLWKQYKLVATAAWAGLKELRPQYAGLADCLRALALNQPAQGTFSDPESMYFAQRVVPALMAVVIFGGAQGLIAACDYLHALDRCDSPVERTHRRHSLLEVAQRQQAQLRPAPAPNLDTYQTQVARAPSGELSAASPPRVPTPTLEPVQVLNSVQTLDSVQTLEPVQTLERIQTPEPEQVPEPVQGPERAQTLEPVHTVETVQGPERIPTPEPVQHAQHTREPQPVTAPSPPSTSWSTSSSASSQPLASHTWQQATRLVMNSPGEQRALRRPESTNSESVARRPVSTRRALRVVRSPYSPRPSVARSIASSSTASVIYVSSSAVGVPAPRVPAETLTWSHNGVPIRSNFDLFAALVETQTPHAGAAAVRYSAHVGALFLEEAPLEVFVRLTAQPAPGVRRIGGWNVSCSDAQALAIDALQQPPEADEWMAIRAEGIAIEAKASMLRNLLGTDARQSAAAFTGKVGDRRLTCATQVLAGLIGPEYLDRIQDTTQVTLQLNDAHLTVPAGLVRRLITLPQPVFGA